VAFLAGDDYGGDDDHDGDDDDDDDDDDALDIITSIITIHHDFIPP